MRREIKFKKVVFSELPNDFVLFKQYNISSKQMYQNLLALHSVDASNQEVITVDDIYAITDAMDSLSVGKPTKTNAVSATDVGNAKGCSLGSLQHYSSEKMLVQSLTHLKDGPRMIKKY